MNRASSIENPAEDIFIVRNSHDHLHDKFPSSGNFRSSVAEIRVFPTNASVDFVHADCVLHLHRLPFFIVDPSVEILDDTKTIASKSKIVRGRAGTALAKIVCRFTMIRRSWVAVRNSHLSKSETVEDGSIIVADISENGALPIIESQSELPFLPGDDFGVLVVDSETNSLGLGNVQRFKVLTEGWLHFR